MAHHIAAWLGIPAGIVIAAMVVLRKRGLALRARRQQARRAVPGRPDSSAPCHLNVTVQRASLSEPRSGR